MKKQISVLLTVLISAAITAHADTIVSRSHTTPPRWITSPPAASAGLAYFVGVSDRCESEQQARDKALENAIRQVAQYAGVDVQRKVSKTINSSSLSSQIYDPRIVRRDVETQVAKAVARSVKATRWYLLKFAKTENGKSVYSYKAKVLANVPQQELRRSIAERIRYYDGMRRAAQKALTIKAAVEQQLRDIVGNMQKDPVKAVRMLGRSEQKADRILIVINPFKEIKKQPFKQAVYYYKQQIHKLQMQLISNPELLLRLKLIGLLSNVRQRPFRFVVGAVLYGDTGLTTGCSRLITDKLEQLATGDDGVYAVLTADDFRRLLQQRGVSLQQVLDTPTVLPVNRRPHGILFVSYIYRNGELAIRLQLKQPGSGRLIKSESITLPTTLFPDCRSFVPSQQQRTRSKKISRLTRQSSAGFKLELWPDKGRYAEYTNGEKLRFRIRASQDCFLYLFSVDSVGRVSLLVPNSFEKNNRLAAGVTRTFPGLNAGYSYPVAPPYGRETVIAVASRSKLKINQGTIQQLRDLQMPGVVIAAVTVRTGE